MAAAMVALVLRFHPGVFRVPAPSRVADSPRQQLTTELATKPQADSRTLWPYPASELESLMCSGKWTPGVAMSGISPTETPGVAMSGISPTGTPGVAMSGMAPIGWMGVAYVAHALFLDLMSTRLSTMCWESPHLGEWVWWWCGWWWWVW